MNEDSIRFRNYIQTVGRGERRAKALGFDDAADAMGLILDGKADPEQRGAFLLACRIRGEDPVEMAGFAHAMRIRSAPLPLPTSPLLLPLAHGSSHAVTVGHPYDGREDTFIAGAGAAIVAAAAGATVILHGAGRVPAKHAPGTADVLESLGLPAHLGPNAATAFVAAHGFVHLDTREFLPVWTGQLAVREMIGLRLPFSSAEKLLDPADTRNIVLGIAHGPYLARMSGAMQRLGVRRGLVVQGLEGSCDLSPQHPARVAEVDAEGVREVAVDPRALGVIPAEVRVIGADPISNATLTLAAFEGNNDAIADTIAFNAAILLWRSGLRADLPQALELARLTIRSGRALERLRSAGISPHFSPAGVESAV